MNICVVGGGNIGTLLAGEMAYKGHKVNLLTSKPNSWNQQIIIKNEETKKDYVGKINKISNNPGEVIPNSDVVFLTVPANCIGKMLSKINKYVDSNMLLGVMPGSGGKEFLFKKYIDKDCCFFGLQRVYSIARIEKYGHSVYMKGRKRRLAVASLKREKTIVLQKLIEELFDTPCDILNNFLEVTLIPSNPLIHTTRLYTLLNQSKNSVWDKEILFYETWDDETSELILKCDKELQTLCSSLDRINLKGVLSLKEYYEANTVSQFTEKIKSIAAFQGMTAPMIETQNGYLIDYNSRYFEEDFPYGLCIIKDFCEICQLDTPNIDSILKWYEKIKNVEYFKDNKFRGKDCLNLNLPQNVGINTKKDIYKYYDN